MFELDDLDDPRDDPYSSMLFNFDDIDELDREQLTVEVEFPQRGEVIVRRFALRPGDYIGAVWKNGLRSEKECFLETVQGGRRCYDCDRVAELWTGGGGLRLRARKVA